MNKYFILLHEIVNYGAIQSNKKGDIKYLINKSITFYPDDIEKIFTEYKVPKGLLQKELDLYMGGVTSVSKYKEQGINWWDYCAPEIINSYPSYYKKLPELLAKINKEKGSSKNYVLYIGETLVDSSQNPCLSIIQFQISKYGLNISVYQRSADSNLGLPCDIYQLYLISKMVQVQLNSLHFFIANAHIYTNNIEQTFKMLKGEEYKFILNV